jgi:hypothetical protein
MFRVDIKPQRAAVTRSLSPPPDCATTAGAATGVMAAPERSDSDGANSHRADSHEALQAEAAETIRRELSRLTALLRRHFSQSGAESLLPALADTSNTEAAAGARAFLTQIRTLAEGLEADAGRWADAAPTAGAFADFRREVLALLAGVEDRIAEVGK